jgi:hypothetical protein
MGVIILKSKLLLNNHVSIFALNRCLILHIAQTSTTDCRHQQVVFSIEMLEKAVKEAAERNGISVQNTYQQFVRKNTPTKYRLSKSPSNCEITPDHKSNMISASKNLICEEEQLMKELDALQQNFPSNLKYGSEYDEEVNEPLNHLGLSIINEIDSCDTKQLSETIAISQKQQTGRYGKDSNMPTLNKDISYEHKYVNSCNESPVTKPTQPTQHASQRYNNRYDTSSNVNIILGAEKLRL